MSNIAKVLSRRQDRGEGVGTNEKAIPFKKQDYQSLKQECLAKGTLFCDPTFPAESDSLGYDALGPQSSKTKGVQWKRPKELCSNPEFIVDGAKRTDICQGALADCWLVASIASLTLDNQFLERVVPHGQSFKENYAGIFHFQFWQFGEWVDVVIDDRLPTKNGKLLFVHSAERSEFWSALLEKAYAKVNGSYESLKEGNTTEGFEDFTGGITESYKLNKAPPHLFKLMQKALMLGSLMGCCIFKSSSQETESEKHLKLVKGHAYSITGAEEVHSYGHPVQLVRMRNPWGRVEWTGPWSDNSEEWNSIQPEERAKLFYSAEDGEFWMAYSDFIQKFSMLEICNLTPDALSSNTVSHWNYSQFEGDWRVGSTAGGCIRNKDTFCSNPQFVIKLEEEDDDPHDGEDGCTILVGLMQKDCRKGKRFGRDLNTIGFAIYKVQGCTVVNNLELQSSEKRIVPPEMDNLENSTIHMAKPGRRLRGTPEQKMPELAVRVTGCKAGQNQTLTSVQRDGSGKLGLVEFHILWIKIQNYMEVFNTHDRDNSGTMSSHEMRDAVKEAGFQLNNDVLQVIISRYANQQFAIDFDSFVDCLIRLEMYFKVFKVFNKKNTGKIDLDIMQWLCLALN
ncbi:calpain-2 catalytic subunit-like [Garra rufa]|uniref:calpain-2 catalytic subunit-like n=1 Tax=Garra rufa TaxID=137080 RepID=UPI003CCEF177